MSAFTLLVALVAPVLSLTEKDGKPAVVWRDRTVVASEVRDAALVPDTPAEGLTSVRLGGKSRVSFPVSGEIAPKMGGALLVWVKPARLTKAVGQAAYDMNVDRDGTYRATKTQIGRMRAIGFNDREDAAVYVSASHCHLPGTAELKVHRNLFAGTWTCLAVSWQERDKSFALVDGVIIPGQHGWGRTTPLALDKLVLGQVQAWCPGFEGEIAGLKMWNRPLTREELRAEYAATQPIAVELRDYALTAGRPSRMRWRLFNLSDGDVTRDFSFTVDGRTYRQKVAVPARGSSDLVFTDVTVAAAGVHRLDTGENRSFQVYAVDMAKSVTDAMRTGDPDWKLVETFDPTQEHPREKMLADRTRVIRKPFLAYREGGANIRDAWCWKPEKIARPNRWHVLEVEFPDDARRYFGVHVYAVNPLTGGITGGQMESMGILTGGFHFNTDRIQRRRLMFRPESEQIEIIVETGPFPRVFAAGSAVSMFRIYEATEDLLPKLPPAANDRELGVWDEDPTMDTEWFARSMFDGDVDLSLWNRRVERIVEYARFMGHNRWTVQVIDYEGDRNGNVLSLPSSTTRSFHGHVDGWVDLYAKVFERERLPWFARMGQSASGRFFKYMLGEAEALRIAQKPSGGAKDVIFNPDPALPESTEAVCRLVREYRDKYADCPMFRGLSFESHRPLHYWDERYGYGDATVALFAKETGVSVPAMPLEKRHDFLMKGDGAVAEKWIAWRCRKVEAFNRAIVAELRRGNDRLQVKAYVFPNRMYRNSAEKGWDIDRELRKFGIDFAALNRIEGYEIAHFAMPDEEVTMSFRKEDNARIAACDHDPAVLGWIADREKRPIANVMMHSNLETYQIPQLPECHFPMGYYGWDASCRTNCYYLSWASCFTCEDKALMPWCSLLANMDVQEIDIGFWGMPEMGAQELMREFYRAFRAIPTGRYELVSGPKDPVAVRACGDNWYMVNKESFKVKVRGGDGEWTVRPGEVKVMKGARPASLEQIVEKTDVRAFERAALNFRIKDVSFKDAFDAALADGDYGGARRLMYRPEGWDALKTLKPFLCRARWRAADRTVEAEITSLLPGSNPFDVRLVSDSPCWGASTNRVIWLGAGVTGVVNLKPSRWPTTDGEGGRVTLQVACHGGRMGYETFDFTLGGAFAYHAAGKAEVGDDWTFARYRMVPHHVEDMDYSNTKQAFDYSLGYLWNEKGLFVAVDVVEPEGHFRPPVKGAGFKLCPVQTDSLQFFFATRGGAPYDQEGFDPDDIECMYYDWSDGEHHGAIHRHAKDADRSQQSVDAQRYADGHLKYEFFIPAEQLPHVAMARGTVIKACGHIYNCFPQKSANDDWHHLITNHALSPYNRPGTWPDLVFVGDRADDGFETLFNGKDLSGWKHIGEKPVWGVKPEEPGVLQYVPEWVDEKTIQWGGGEQLWTARDYTNFVFRFEFMMPSNGNNGVGIRMDPLKDSAYFGFCEVQLLDDGGTSHYDAERKKDRCGPAQYCGSVYGVLPARRDNPDARRSAGGGSYARRAGEWNAAEIEVVGGRVKVTLNGTVVTEGDVSAFKGNGDTMDGKPHPGLRRRSGPIGFLGYKGHNVKFRNIRVKDL